MNLVGMVQYFYHSPSSSLPVRDVRNEQGQGSKTEPHIEFGLGAGVPGLAAENQLKDCYQANLRRFHRDVLEPRGEGTLYLVTRCANRSLAQYNLQYIVGWMLVLCGNILRPLLIGLIYCGRSPLQ